MHRTKGVWPPFPNPDDDTISASPYPGKSPLLQGRGRPMVDQWTRRSDAASLLDTVLDHDGLLVPVVSSVGDEGDGSWPRWIQDADVTPEHPAR